MVFHHGWIDAGGASSSFPNIVRCSRRLYLQNPNATLCRAQWAIEAPNYHCSVESHPSLTFTYLRNGTCDFLKDVSSLSR